MYKLLFTVITVSSLVLNGCKQVKKQITTVADKNLSQEIENMIWKFHAADTSMNADKVIDLMWPESTLLIDGKTMNYLEMKKGVTKFMPTLTLFHTEWTDLKIVVEHDSSAISSFNFRDSIITKEGKLSQSKGPNTFVWQKRKDIWKVIHVEAIHNPIGE